ncbi:hypothetical protein BDZ94DRAFT_1267260 [Collybia nuda]|uniref:Uncharacterized protein n=1 Tax=Collybia nuda TaxID=64659 RepID=A0A9P6CBR7_9AGAR|nr:hypothetical protein BDZ94DRAFT_1267260 [Collybia nuda]
MLRLTVSLNIGKMYFFGSLIDHLSTLFPRGPSDVVWIFLSPFTNVRIMGIDRCNGHLLGRVEWGWIRDSFLSQNECIQLGPELLRPKSSDRRTFFTFPEYLTYAKWKRHPFDRHSLLFFAISGKHFGPYADLRPFSGKPMSKVISPNIYSTGSSWCCVVFRTSQFEREDQHETTQPIPQRRKQCLNLPPSHAQSFEIYQVAVF